MRGAALCLVVGAALASASGCGGRSEAAGDPTQAAAVAFLDRYVDPDGRVVRRDQGGDTVSEGQAYGLLLAASTGDGARFERIWAWTRAHLQRPDGLLSWHWAGGRVADPQSAADADLDAARALLIGAIRFGDPGLRDAAVRLGRAILDQETTTAADKLVLVAGPWARRDAIVNPSYWSARAYRALGAATGDARFGALAASSRRLVDRLTERAPGPPPDWARVHPWGVQAVGPPGTGVAPAYGYDAVRTPVRLAESCDAADRSIAARAWPALRTDPGAPIRDLAGTRQAGGESPAALVGAAGAATAAGDRDAAAGLLDRAAAADAAHPTYYGAAWVALGRTMLTTTRLGACP